MHREAQEGRLKNAESTVRRLEQQAKELQGMTKKGCHGPIQTKREETNRTVHETS